MFSNYIVTCSSAQCQRKDKFTSLDLFSSFESSYSHSFSSQLIERQMIFVLLLLFCSSTDVAAEEHWFVIRPAEISAFQIHLFDLIVNRSMIFSFILSTSERVIRMEINDTTFTQLSVERADLIENNEYQMIFLVIRENLHIETFVNCKKIDSFSDKFVNEIDRISFDYVRIDPMIEMEKLSSANVAFFDSKGCKTSTENATILPFNPKLTRQMENLIEKIQMKTTKSNSLTIVYRPNPNDLIDDHSRNSSTIFRIPSLNFRLEFLPNESIIRIDFDDEEFLLFVGKSADRLDALKNRHLFFIEFSSTTITSYVNCERIDREYFDGQRWKKLLDKQNEWIFDRRSTLIFQNETLEKISEKVFCSKLDRKHLEILPEKLRLKKLSKNLEILLKNFDVLNERNVSQVDIPPINSFGSLKNNEEIPMENLRYEQSCSTDDDCKFNETSMICQINRCVCGENDYWSTKRNRCSTCHDLLIGHRCFRFSTHKSNWFQANDYCRNLDENAYPMKLTSNLNRTEIEHLKQSFVQMKNDEELDYIYWIGAMKTSSEVSRRTRREIFRWFDIEQTATIPTSNLWCSQINSNSMKTNELCISIAACGLYIDDCQRNYRYICEAI